MCWCHLLGVEGNVLWKQKFACPEGIKELSSSWYEDTGPWCGETEPRRHLRYGRVHKSASSSFECNQWRGVRWKDFLFIVCISHILLQKTERLFADSIYRHLSVYPSNYLTLSNHAYAPAWYLLFVHSIYRDLSVYPTLSYPIKSCLCTCVILPELVYILVVYVPELKNPFEGKVELEGPSIKCIELKAPVKRLLLILFYSSVGCEMCKLTHLLC